MYEIYHSQARILMGFMLKITEDIHRSRRKKPISQDMHFDKSGVQD